MEPRKGGSTAWRGHAVGAVIAAAAFVGLWLMPYLQVPDPDGVLRKALIATFILGSTWTTLAVLGRVFEKLMPKDRSVAHTRSTWKVVSYVTWFAVLVILVFGLLGNVAQTALSLGLLGAGLTFAMQKPILNFAGWVVITYRQLYRIGDRVEVGGVKGYVLDIGLQTTELQEFGLWMPGDEFTGRQVAIPNGVIFDGATSNYTKDFPFVWDRVDVLVTYESDIDAAKEIAISTANEVVGGIMYNNFEKYREALAIRDLEDSLLRTPEVRMHMEMSGVNLSIVYFVQVEKRGKIKAKLVEKLWRRFAHDPRVEIAYPHIQSVEPRQHGSSTTPPPKVPEWMVSPPGGHP